MPPKRQWVDFVSEPVAKKVKKIQKQTTIAEIDPQGDMVILVGNPSDKNGSRLARVNSALLVAVSPVFRAMLGPNFNEGRSKHDSSNPLKLPEDGPDATVNMFHLIHYNSTNVCLPLDGDLAGLFVVCQKYKVAENFRDFFKVRIQCSEKASPLDKVDHCVIAAFVGLKDEFKKYSPELMSETKEFILERGNKSMVDHLPQGILDYLVTYRLQTYRENIVAANTFFTTKYGKHCENVANCIGEWVVLLVDKVYCANETDRRLFNLPAYLESLTIAGDLKSVRALTCTARCSSCRNHKLFDDALKTVIAAAKLSDIRDGLCYECFREDRIGMAGKCAEHH